MTMKFAVLGSFFLLAGCGSAPAPVALQPAKPVVHHAKITQFYAVDKMIARGLTGKLCYGVENTKRLDMEPPSEDVWPSLTRCFEITPKQTTKYTLTAYGEDGGTDVKSVEVRVGGAPPRIYDLVVSGEEVQPGELVRVCFKLENAVRAKASPGKFAPGVNCLNDNPKKTTAYHVTAYGEEGQEDNATVTVRVK